MRPKGCYTKSLHFLLLLRNNLLTSSSGGSPTSGRRHHATMKEAVDRLESYSDRSQERKRMRKIAGSQGSPLKMMHTTANTATDISPSNTVFDEPGSSDALALGLKRSSNADSHADRATKALRGSLSVTSKAFETIMKEHLAQVNALQAQLSNARKELSVNGQTHKNGEARVETLSSELEHERCKNIRL